MTRDILAMTQAAPRNRWKKLIIILLTVLVALIGASYLVYTQLDSGRIPPLALLALAAVISLAIPMVRSNFFPSAKDCETEYAFHEQRLEREITDGINNALGPEPLRGLFSASDSQRASTRAYVDQLLEEEKIRQSPDLQFALLIAMARFHEKAGDPRSSIVYLKQALDIRPEHFIARMHLAGNLEWTGETAAARRHYRRLLEHPDNLSRAMAKLATAKMKAIAGGP